MKAIVIIGAQAAYACLTGETFTMDVRLAGGRSASTSLRESAADLREKAAECIQRAERMEEGAQLLEGDQLRTLRRQA